MNKLLWILLFVFFLAELSMAKPFYLTIRRDYSPAEKPQLEVNYSFTSPIYIKILEPEDKKQFISTQIDLRRAWKKPGYEFNPAHFMNLGFNDDNSNFDWLRQSLNYGVKQPLVDSLGGSHDTPTLSPSKLGPEKLIQIPKGFKLRNEIVLNPEAEDTKKNFDVPGFEDYYGWMGSGRLNTKVVDLPKLPSGFYLVQVIQGNNEGQVVLAVNDILGYMQRSGEAVLYKVFDRLAKPISGAQVSIRNLNGTWVQEVKTDANGEAKVDGIKENDLLTVISSPQGTAIIDSEYFATQVSFPDMYLFTDRPLYRGGDTVFFKGILRNLANGRSQLNPEKNAVKIEIYNVAEGKVSTSTSVKFSEFGTFNGQIKLNEMDEAGLFRVVAKLNKIEHASEVRVKDYVKPIYFLKLENDKDTAKQGDTLKFKVQAERYAGGNPKIINANVQVYRMRKDSPQWIDDAGVGETGSTVTYGDDGDKGAKSMAPEVIVPEMKIEFDESGRSEFEVKIPSDLKGPKNLNYTYKVEVYTQDSDDNIIYGSKSFFDLASEVSAAARFTKIVVESGKEAQLIVQSKSVLGKLMPDIDGEVKFILKEKVVQTKKIKTNAKGTAKVDLPEDPNLVGEMKAEVTLWDKNKNPNSQKAEIVLVGKTPGVSAVSGDEIRLLTNQSEVSQNEMIKIFVALPDKWGSGGANSGMLFVTLAGPKIFKTLTLPVNGRSLWINEQALSEYGNQIYFVISYLHPDRGWIEKRASFKILDPDKKLKVQWISKTDVVVPGGEQTLKFRILNSAGKGVRSEVALAVVDQAVLDLQPEFRPKLHEFFYPSTRLNLMSFYSSHFQGYGYGELIAKLFNSNHILAAGKNQSKPMDIKDTAFWKANVVTNEKGDAEVKFKLPGNQTIWRVTVVVLDKDGRFGESTTQFKSHLPVSLLVGYPPFLRGEDKSRIRVNITGNEITQELMVKYSAQSQDKQLLSFTGKSDFSTSLKPKGQFADNIALSAGETNTAKATSFVGTLSFDKSSLGFQDSLRVFPKSTVVNDFYYPDSNTMTLTMDKDEKAQGLELKIYNDFASILFSNLEWLVQYPYGCVEQTLNTTISNNVISDVLRQAKTDGLKLDGGQENTLKAASDNASVGFKRLTQYQGAKGGFGWFTDSGEPDLNMSLLVMLNLTLSDKTLSVPFYDFRPTYDWLSTKGILPGSPQGIVFSFIESVFIRKYMSERDTKELKTILRTQNDYVLKSGTVFERALHLMTLTNHSFTRQDFMNEFNSLVESVKKSLEQMKDTSSPIQYGNFSPQTQNGWQAYPGRAVSTIAIGYRSLVFAQEFINAPTSKSKNQTASPVKITYISDALNKLIRKNVLASFNGYYFGSTFDNGVTLTSMRDIISVNVKGNDPQALAKKIEVSVNGKSVPASDLEISSHITGINVTVKNVKNLNDQTKVSVNSVMDNQMVRGKLAKLSPVGNAKSKSSGWGIDRMYYRLNEKGEKKEIQSGEKLAVGDLVYCEIKFSRNTDKNFWHSRYYVVTNDTPAGFQTIQEDQVYRGSPYNLPLMSSTKTREILNHQSRWFFDFTRGWMDKATQVGIVYRVQYPGEFSAGIAKIEDFYDETKASYTRTHMFSVESKQ